MFKPSLFILLIALSGSTTPTWLLTKDGCRQLTEDAITALNQRVDTELGGCVSRDEGDPPYVRIYRCNTRGSYFYFWTQAKCEEGRAKLQKHKQRDTNTPQGA